MNNKKVLIPENINVPNGVAPLDSNNYVPLANLHNLDQLLANKVDKVDGKGLSKNDFTDTDLAKLNSLSNYTGFRGVQTTLALVQSTYATATNGDWAIISNPTGNAYFAVWDVDTNTWVNVGQTVNPPSTNLSYTLSGDTLTITSSTGTGTVIPLVTNTTAGLMSFKDKVKLNSLSGFTNGSALFADTNGNISQDNANYFWDAINHRLGIGTITPSYDIHIKNSVTNAVLAVDSNGSFAQQLVFLLAGVKQWKIDSDPVVFGGFGITNYGTINGVTNPKSVWVNKLTNKVAIGASTNPQYQCDIFGDARISVVPTITNATKVLVRDPTTQQISEQKTLGIYSTTTTISNGSTVITHNLNLTNPSAVIISIRDASGQVVTTKVNGYTANSFTIVNNSTVNNALITVIG